MKAGYAAMLNTGYRRMLNAEIAINAGNRKT